MPKGSPMTPDQWHGTVGGYTNHRCRCDDCTRAWREYRLPYLREYRRQKYGDGKPCATAGCPRLAAQCTGTDYCVPCRQAQREAAA